MSKRAISLIILAATLAGALGMAGCGPAGERERTLLFILAGQSNMSGRGEPRELPPGFPAHGERIQNFSNADVWAEAREPLDHPRGQKDACSLDLSPGVGPGLAFAQRLGELLPTAYVGLIPCARGGASLAQWAPGPSPASLYGSSLRRARLAGQKGRVAGVLFHQGESDAGSLTVVRAWPSRFADLVTAWRRDLGDPGLPVVFCQIGDLAPRWRRTPGFRHWEELRQAQATVRLPGVAMVATGDLPLMPDGIHLSTGAQLILGRRLAQAMYELLEQRKAVARP